jgi:urea transport system permease protein
MIDLENSIVAIVYDRTTRDKAKPQLLASIASTFKAGSLLLSILVLSTVFATISAAETSVTVSTPSTDFAAIVSQLSNANYSEKSEIVKQLVALKQPGTKPLLVALLEGNLYTRTTDSKVFIAAEKDGALQLTDAVTTQDAGTADATAFDKIGANNSLRKLLRGLIAEFDLSSDDVDTRLAAAKDIMHSPEDANIDSLRSFVAKEKNTKVRDTLHIIISFSELSSESADVRLAAIDKLANSTNADVYNRLKSLTEKDGDDYREPDERVRIAAIKAINHIERWRDFYSILETTFFGLSLGSVLVLAAIGLAITFGVMGVINMAHGELMMLGAYTTYVMQLLMPNHLGASIIVAIPAAFIVSGFVGMLIERGVVKFLYGRPLETLLATFGVSLILQQVVRDIFTANNRPVETPAWLAGSLQINEAFSITNNRMYIVLFTMIVFVALLAVLKKTRLGLNVRAVAQNRAMAKAMGIRSEWVDTVTFGLGSGIAGIAGVALSQLTNVGPNLGQQYIVDSFMVVVFGGVGNLWGTLIGGMSLGVVNKVLEPYSGAVLAKIFVLIALILFIQRRPRGLFPQKGRAAEH